MRTRRWSRRAIAWVRLGTALLSLVVALGGALPALARLVSGPSAHVCHCETGGAHAHCACPICFPELDDSLDVRVVTISGKCGEDVTGWRAFFEPGLLLAPSTGVVAALPVTASVTPVAELSSRRVDPPEPPPPRA